LSDVVKYNGKLPSNINLSKKDMYYYSVTAWKRSYSGTWDYSGEISFEIEMAGLRQDYTVSFKNDNRKKLEEEMNDFLKSI
jgi:hypothetical protein